MVPINQNGLLPIVQKYSEYYFNSFCFQAALILFGQNQGNSDFQNDNFCSEVSKMLPELLVTAPNEKRKVSL